MELSLLPAFWLTLMRGGKVADQETQNTGFC